MRKAKTVRFKETVDVYVSPSSLVLATEDENYLTNIAQHIAKRAITTAVESVTEENKNIIKNIKWLTHGEFTVERCRRQIQLFIARTWNKRGLWAHHTKLTEKKDMGHSFYYKYTVRFAMPTANIPMALGSVAAFFTIKFNKNKPKNAPIDVSYTFESQKLLNRPGMAKFRDEWHISFIEGREITMAAIPF